jgi:hypothetical protein
VEKVSLRGWGGGSGVVAYLVVVLETGCDKGVDGELALLVEG